MASSPAANKRRGAQWEIDIVKALRDEGYDAERLHLNGAEDEGDVIVRRGGRYVTVEAKNASLKPTEFLRQAELEAGHFARHRGLDEELVHPVVFVKRARQGVGEGLALLTINEYLRLVTLATKEC